jgi:DNA (cytosine-5)-methyltransferase 1
LTVWEHLSHNVHIIPKKDIIMQHIFADLCKKTGLSNTEIAAHLGISDRQLKRLCHGTSNIKPIYQKVVEALVFTKSQPEKQKAFKFVDLFAGIGGIRKGFESIGGECIFTCEWDKYAQQTYQANFSNDEHTIHGDIKTIAPESIPDHDVLLAGFPCQPFSIAGVSKKNSLGKSHGFACDTQGTLFFEVAKIIHEKRPAAFLLENVKNLVNHDRGRTFETIIDVLKNQLGYEVHCRVIDARAWVPQHRERIFIVGFREGTDFDFNNFEIPDASQNPTLGSILEPADQVDEKYTLSDKLWSYLQAYAEKHRLKGNGFGFGLFDETGVARTLSARYYKDGSEILIKQAGKNPRRLTPKECARLMGFERRGNSFKIPVSNTQAYKQFGNSVAVPVVEAVALLMQPYIMKLARPDIPFQHTLFALPSRDIREAVAV